MSRQATPILAITRRAAGAILANRFVTHGNIQAGAGLNTLGVARSPAATGESLTVDVLGTAVVEAGAAIADGALLESNASGQAVPRSTGAIIGRALAAAAAAGQFIEILLIPN